MWVLNLIQMGYNSNLWNYISNILMLPHIWFKYMEKNKKIKLYSQSEHKVLIEHYNNLLKDKLYGESVKLRALMIVEIKYPDSKYRVRVNGYLIAQPNIEFFQDIDSFCNDNGLVNPEQVLANQNWFRRTISYYCPT